MLLAYSDAEVLSVSIKGGDNHMPSMANHKPIQSSLRCLPSGRDNLLYPLICKRI